MTAATSIARWLLDEASSGTTPTTCADDTGNGNALQIDYSSGDAAWTSIASGNGWDVTATDNTAVGPKLYITDAVSTGNIVSSLNNAVEASLLIDCDIATPSSTVTLLRIANQASGSACLSVLMDSSRQIALVWGAEYGTYGGFDWQAIATGRTIIGIRIDSSLATSADRAILYVNGSAVSIQTSGDNISQNLAFAQEPGYNPSVSLMNNMASSNNAQGKIYYAELFTGSLTTTQLGDANTALSADNDANWAGGGSGFIPAFAINSNRII